MSAVDPSVKLFAVGATLAGVGITVWTIKSGSTNVGTGLTRRRVTWASNPATFAAEVLKLVLATAMMAAFAVYVFSRA